MRQHLSLFDQPVEIAKMNYTHLTREERYRIYALKKVVHTQSKIVAVIDRRVSTISRELARNRGARGYRPKQAHNKAVEWKAINARAIDDATWQFAQEKLMLQGTRTRSATMRISAVRRCTRGFYAGWQSLEGSALSEAASEALWQRQIGAASSPTARPLSNIRLSSTLEAVSATGRQIPSSARTTGRPSSAWSTERLNNRPRKRLGYQTPNQVFFKSGVALHI